jgi:hypothetical protein
MTPSPHPSHKGRGDKKTQKVNCGATSHLLPSPLERRGDKRGAGASFYFFFAFGPLADVMEIKEEVGHPFTSLSLEGRGLG